MIDKTTAVYVEEGFLGYDSCAYVFEKDGEFDIWSESIYCNMCFEGTVSTLEDAKNFISNDIC